MDYVFKLPEPPEEKVPHKNKRGHIRVQTLNEDGTWTIEDVDLGEEFAQELDDYQAEMKRLREAGTPYWCIHEGRSVTHPAAYWKEDGYEREDGLEMQYTHGVMCGDCGGYIQEG